MSIDLNNSLGEETQISNIFWCYVLNLGEMYGWKPIGTKLDIESWNGGYDSSDGQIVRGVDALNLANSLKSALTDNKFEETSESLKLQMKKALEEGTGIKIKYEIISGDLAEALKNIINFMEKGEFTIN